MSAITIEAPVRGAIQTITCDVTVRRRYDVAVVLTPWFAATEVVVRAACEARGLKVRPDLVFDTGAVMKSIHSTYGRRSSTTARRRFLVHLDKDGTK